MKIDIDVMASSPAKDSKIFDDIRTNVKEFYGERLQTSDDLATNACTTWAQKMPKYISDVMKLIHEGVVMKYYGCGLVVPECLEGMKILDLGSGSGRDSYAMAKLVGENGFVTGVDMTDQQLEVANEYIEYHRDIFGFKKPNTKFVNGYIENLRDAGIDKESIDIIISNCVINLCKDKESVLREAYHVLKPGGELYFSDVYADRDLSDEIRSRKELWGEGLGGALNWRDLYSFAKQLGFEIPRTVTASPFEITRPDYKAFVGDARFFSVVYRLFKLPSNVARENAQVMYKGGITGHPDKIKFDHKFTFYKDDPVTVDCDTAAIIRSSRLKDQFSITKALGCGNPDKTLEIDPFEVVNENGSAPKGDCCPASK